MLHLENTFHIGKRIISTESPSYIIAEAGSNHNRDIKLAYRLIDIAAAARADAVKFQTFSADKIASKIDNSLTRIDFAGMKSLHELYAKIELPREWHKDLFEYAEEKQIAFLSTPFDEKAVEELHKLGVNAFKIASFEITHFPLLKIAAQTGKPVLLSTGMANLGEIEEAIQVLIENGCNQVGLFHCGISYPMPPEEINLKAMETMATAFQCPVGYSDHSLDITIPIAAVARGAKLIEKHFTLDKTLPGPDHSFALDPEELKLMVESIKTVEKAIGSHAKGTTESEKIHKKRGRRSLFARKDINKGTIVNETMISVLRPASGLHPRHLKDIIGRKILRDISENEPITWDHFMT